MKPSHNPRTSDFGLRTLRRQHWVKWIQIFTVALWSLFPPFYIPMPAAWEPDFTADPLWTGTPTWTGVAPEPTDGPDWGHSDDDGLPNWFEVWLGTCPGNPDSDSDGISDYDELFHTGTNPKHWDSDGDGFSDHDASYGCWAVNHNDVGFGTAVYDWDGDGLYNHEDSFPFDPFNGSGSGVIDSDGDSVDDNYDSHPWDFTLWNDWNDNGVNDHEEDPSSNPGDGTEDGSSGGDGDGNGTGDGDGAGSTPIDSDGDGVTDDLDSHPWNTSLWNDHNQNGFNDHEEPPDPYTTDSDYDGVVDADDSHPWNSFLWNDHNHNGVNDHEETIDEPDPFTLDSDGDGLTNLQEIELGTDPYMADTDGDGLSDFQEVDLEVGYGTNPLHPDTDGDGLTDSEELMVQPTSNPLDAHSLSKAAGYGTLYTDWQMTDTTDTDGDGIPDRIEIFYDLWLDPNNPQDAGWDADGDQVTNLQAYLNGWVICATVKPLDRDGDGITDVQEDYWNSYYPGMFSKFQFGDAVRDADGDDLTNYQEIVTYGWLGLDPGNANTHSPTHPDYLFVYWLKVKNEVSSYLNEPLVPDPNGTELDSWWNHPLLSSISKPASNDELNSWLVDADNNNDGSPDGSTALLAYLTSSGSPLPPPGRQTPTDYDGDGLPDVWEWRFRPQIDMWKMDGGGHPNTPLPPLPKTPELNEFEGLVPNPEEAFEAAWHAHQVLQSQRARIDPDGDGLSNLAEYTQGTHPFIADTDGDGINDGDELAYGSSPTSAGSLPPVVLSTVSGDQQMIGHLEIGTHPLIVRATRAGKPLAGAQVQFTADESSGVSLSAVPTESWQPSLPLVTQADGTIGVRMKAGSVTTAVTITAQAGSGAAVTFSLEVREPTDPILLAYLAQQGGGVQPGIDPKPEPDPTEVRLMTRTREVIVKSFPNDVPTQLPALAVEKSNGSTSEAAWFYPAPGQVQDFQTLEDLDAYLLSVQPDLDWQPGGYVDWSRAESMFQQFRVGSENYQVVYGVYGELGPPTWFYGGSWGNPRVLDAQPLLSHASVANGIASGQTLGSPGTVIPKLAELLNPADRSTYQDLPAKRGSPFHVEDYSRDTNQIGGQFSYHREQQAKILGGKWQEVWIARTGDDLPEASMVAILVTERFQDELGNALVTPEILKTDLIKLTIPANEKNSTVSTLQPFEGAENPPATNNPAFVLSDGVLFLKPETIGVQVRFTPIHLKVNTDRSFNSETGAETINELDDPGKDEWKPSRGAVLHVNYDVDAELPDNEFDAITYDAQQNPAKENWAIENEKDQMDLSFMEVEGIESLPAATHVFLRSRPKPPPSAGTSSVPTSSHLAEVGAFHLYAMNRSASLPTFTPLWGGRKNGSAPSGVVFTEEVDITIWVNKNALGYIETRPNASGPYRFAIEGLIYPGMKLGNGEAFDGDIRIAVSIATGNGQFQNLDVVALGMPRQDYDTEGRAKCPQNGEGTYPGVAVNAHNGKLLPSFPGAEGFGRWSSGGRFGAVLAVTKNTDDGSAGTLRWALTQNVPRTVLIRLPEGMDGTIHLQDKLELGGPTQTFADLTLAGHSASPGLCLADQSTILRYAQNIILRYMRFRPAGVTTEDKDALDIIESDHIIVDHCSATWATDETLSVIDSKRVTLQWNLIADSRGQELKGGILKPHNFGSLLRGLDETSLYSVHHNYWAHHRGRTPRLGASGAYEFQTDKNAPGPFIDVRSNVMWNPENFGVAENDPQKLDGLGFSNSEDYYKWTDDTRNGVPQHTYFDAPSRYNLVNNHYWSDSKPEMALLKESSSHGRGHLVGNSRGEWPGMDQALAIDYQSNKPLSVGKMDENENWTSESDKKGTWLPALPSDTTLATFNDNLPTRPQRIQSESEYLSQPKHLPDDPADAITSDPPPLRSKLSAAKGVGASHFRDVVDTAVLINQSTANDTHPLLTAIAPPADTDGDGLPDDYEDSHGLNKKDAKDANLDVDGNGYSNLEEYLEFLLQ